VLALKSLGVLNMRLLRFAYFVRLDVENIIAVAVLISGFELLAIALDYQL
jgi:hypothetical protein